MEKGRLAVILFLALAACSSRDGMPAMAYKNPRDVLVVGLGLDEMLGDTCNRPLRRNGQVYAIEFVGAEKCFKFGAPQKYHGVWLREFEVSAFFEGRTELPLPKDYFTNDGTWLETGALDLPPEFGRCWDRHPWCAFSVDFVGRRSAYRGHYGHMGDYPSAIVVDKIEAIHELPTPAGGPLEFGPEVALPPVHSRK